MINTTPLRIAMVLCFWPHSAEAQSCPLPARPYFEFQVEQPATFIVDTTISPRPAVASRGSQTERPTLVSFVVDTLGFPDSGTFRVIREVDPALALDAEKVVAKWRFRPARLKGCAVPQLVQTPLQR